MNSSVLFSGSVATVLLLAPSSGIGDVVRPRSNIPCGATHHPPSAVFTASSSFVSAKNAPSATADQIPWAVSFAVDLKRIRRLQAGWDGPGSVKISDHILTEAGELVSAALRGVEKEGAPPFVAPGGDGSLQIEWHEKHGELELLIEPDGTLSIWGRDYRNGSEFEGSDTKALDLFYRWAPWMASRPNDVVDVSAPSQRASFRFAA